MNKTNYQGPHQGRPIRFAGEALEHANAAMIMLHGRGATAADILTLVPPIAQPHIAFLAPEAQNDVWYPNRYLAPLAENEPWLSSALQVVEEMLDRVADAEIPPERTMLLGFSQGACLALEFAARNPRRYGAVIGLTGALIGPPETRRDYPGSLQGSPVFIGCSEKDIHIAKERAVETAQVLKGMGAQVTLRLYSNMGHEVNQDELDWVRDMVAHVIGPKIAA